MSYNIHNIFLGYAKRYKLLLMYYREKIAPHLLDMSHGILYLYYIKNYILIHYST